MAKFIMLCRGCGRTVKIYGKTLKTARERLPELPGCRRGGEYFDLEAYYCHQCVSEGKVPRQLNWEGE